MSSRGLLVRPRDETEVTRCAAARATPGNFSDCLSGACVAGKCRCTNQVYVFNVSSSVGGPLTFAEWPGGAQTQGMGGGCDVTVDLPDEAIHLVGLVADQFKVTAFNGYSDCFGTGGEDGDGCAVVTCPPLASGLCQDTRPSCTSALKGVATAQYTVKCIQ